MECGKVQSRETIVTSASFVQKDLQRCLFLLSKLRQVYLLIDSLTTTAHDLSALVFIILQDELNNYFASFLDILVGSIVNRGVSTLIIDFLDIKFTFCRV